MENPQFELSLTRLIDAPREKLFEAWTDPEQMMKWFAPLPITTPICRTDPRPGGEFHAIMRGEDGTEYPCVGVYLEATAPSRIVFTDAYTVGWVPSAKPFMTTVLTFEEEDGKTRYTARARHWTAEDLKTHEAMGFHEGWGQCADQLEALVTQS